MLESLLWSLIAATSPGVTQLTPGYVFVTTQNGTGNLSTWPGANGQTGLAAADTICQADAAAVQLADPQLYIAFMSDSNTDLYCRLHGLAGTKANNCGGASLPAFAGPWLRRDGIPFATLATLGSPGRAIMPVLLTAAGADDAGGQAYTGTAAGLVALNTCGNWTSTSGNSTVMFVDTVDVFNGGSNCTIARSLVCAKSGAHTPLNYAQRSGRVSFVAQEQGNGNLSSWANANGATGLAAGDQVCQREAAAANQRSPGSFKAWLSNSGQSINAIDRFQNDGPWVREDGLPIAASKAALTLPQSIQSLPTVLGTALLPGDIAVTGTLYNGVAAGNDCKGWTSASSSDSFVSGSASSIEFWTQFGLPGCDSTFSTLYCFSDLDRVFDSGMESIPY